MHLVSQEHPALSTVSTPVPHGEDCFTTITDMWDLLRKSKGCGLAANQVGITKRIILVATPHFTGAIINPVITKLSGNKKASREGCLSFPNQQKKISRDGLIVIEGFDENWVPIKKKVRALTAFAFQHEIDHLNGVTIMERG
jgi:peptide deformylase